VVIPIDEEVIEWRMTGPHALPTRPESPVLLSLDSGMNGHVHRAQRGRAAGAMACAIRYLNLLALFV